MPQTFNIGVDVAFRQAPADVALVELDANGTPAYFCFGDIRRMAGRLANVLHAYGLSRADRVAILLSQRHETAVAHVAIYISGMIAVPLFLLFGEDAIEFRLRDSGARAIVTDEEGVAKLNRIQHALPSLEHIFCINGDVDGTISFHDALRRASDDFEPVLTRSDDPALIIYTSGTTGNPKGALHAHRVLLGHLPGVVYPHNRFPQVGDRFWTPADWAWIGGLLDVLLPSWHYGVPVVAYRAPKFDPSAALDLMVRHEIRNVFMPPTALRLLRQSGERRASLNLRSVASGGESLGGDLVEWGRDVLGLTINEFYGQTECNLVLGNGEGLPEARTGWTGTAIPGHIVRVVGNDGSLLPFGNVGNIAILHPDPVMFIRYWENPAATAAKFVGSWLLTGDLGVQDNLGYFKFIGREDDLITSSGYRIGPGEIEECLMRHPAVAKAGVVGVPDPIRTQVVKAVIVLAKGFEPTAALSRDIQNFVRSRLAAHEYPRVLEFAAELPSTATGKIQRRKLRGS